RRPHVHGPRPPAPAPAAPTRPAGASDKRCAFASCVADSPYGDRADRHADRPRRGRRRRHGRPDSRPGRGGRRRGRRGPGGVMNDRASSEYAQKTANRPIKVTAAGQVIASGQSGVVSHVTLLAGSDAATLTLYDGTDNTGTPIAFLVAAAESVDRAFYPSGVRYSN